MAPTTPKDLPRWRVSRIVGNRAREIGELQAADANAAIKRTIREYGINNPGPAEQAGGSKGARHERRGRQLGRHGIVRIAAAIRRKEQTPAAMPPTMIQSSFVRGIVRYSTW